MPPSSSATSERREENCMSFRFKNRAEAGRLLAAKLESYAGREGLIVLGLPRGGVPVAFEVAARLKAPLDIFVARKLGLPGHEELALGAVASGGVCCFNDTLLKACHIPRRVLDEIIERERKELEGGNKPTAGITPSSSARAARLARPLHHPGGRRPGDGGFDARRRAGRATTAAGR